MQERLPLKRNELKIRFYKHRKGDSNCTGINRITYIGLNLLLGTRYTGNLLNGYLLFQLCSKNIEV
jgi:hypothetical protein